MLPIESEVLSYAKLAKPEDVKFWLRKFKKNYGAEIVTAKLEGLLGVDGAAEFLAWLKQQPATTGKNPAGAGTPDADSATVAPALRSAKWDGFPRVKFDCPVIETWPRKTEKKTVCGQLFLNGKKVEWVAPGRQWSTVVNATVAGKYFQDIRSGQAVTISLADINGKNETNRVELFWP
jgi:hypothetical protein